MDAEGVFQDLIGHLKGRETKDVNGLFIDHLQSQGYWVTDELARLREYALKETDLVEPE